MSDSELLPDTPLLKRRRFLSALAASVVAANCPLPTGFPSDAGNGEWYYWDSLAWEVTTRWFVHLDDNGRITNLDFRRVA